jgi:N-acetylmuramic acid 6-phosphate etherase
MDHLQTEARNPASTNLDELTPLELVQLMNREDGRVIGAVASQAAVIARAIEIIAEHLRMGGRLVYVGAGTSGRLGVLDATECPPTFSSPPGQVVGVIAGGPNALTQAVEGAEDRPQLAEQDLEALALGGRDVLVGIATSGRTPYVLAALRYARSQGTYTISLSCNPQSDLEALADLAITPVVGPEVLSGSTRLKAGTATKLVLNMLSTGAMVCLGKTYGNLMVDLRATNSKLRARANRIVRTITGISVEEADALLQQCGGELKTALVAQRAKVTAAEARARLQASGGQVGRALQQCAATSVDAAVPSIPAQLYLGIDGGGSRTVALLASSAPGSTDSVRGRILGRGEAGPSNIQAVGSARALGALQGAIAGAFAAAKVSPMPVTAACLGLAGAGRAEDQQVIQEWARAVRLAENIEVTTDAAILLAAGTPEGWGLALVAGTGSIAYGRKADGQTARAGGWGHLLGDEGSAYALVVAGLRAVARAADGRGIATTLTERFLAQLGLSRPQELVPAIYRGSLDRVALASWARLVLDAADDGDAVAIQIVDEAARELAHAAVAVAQMLNFDRTTIPLALSGGVLLASAGYRKRVLEALESLGVRADPITVVQEPAEGALRRCAEMSPAATVKERLMETTP